MAYEKKDGEIGALWLRSNDRGEYMTGEINGEKVLCQAIKSDNPKAPKWRVMKSKPREDAPGGHGGGV